MLNQQAPLPVEREHSGFLHVHSIFNTIQGEGPFSGEAATFIRLYGCNLQCPWCDTDYTSKAELCSPLALADEVLNNYQMPRKVPNPLVVITGGEPFRQNITPIVKLLAGMDFRVQIESNGTLYPGDDFPWSNRLVTVVVSPKTGKIHPTTARKAHVYKYVLSWDAVASDGLPETALSHTLGRHDRVARPPADWEGPIFLNPMDAQDEITNMENMKAVVRSVMTFQRFRMGIQLHKHARLP